MNATASFYHKSFEFLPCEHKLPWDQLLGINLDHVTSTTNVDALQSIIKVITFADITEESSNPQKIFHLSHAFRLAQLIIQYLLYTQERLTLLCKKRATQAKELRHKLAWVTLQQQQQQESLFQELQKLKEHIQRKGVFPPQRPGSETFSPLLDDWKNPTGSAFLPLKRADSCYASLPGGRLSQQDRVEMEPMAAWGEQRQAVRAFSLGDLGRVTHFPQAGAMPGLPTTSFPAPPPPTSRISPSQGSSSLIDFETLATTVQRLKEEVEQWRGLQQQQIYSNSRRESTVSFQQLYVSPPPPAPAPFPFSGLPVPAPAAMGLPIPTPSSYQETPLSPAVPLDPYHPHDQQQPPPQQQPPHNNHPQPTPKSPPRPPPRRRHHHHQDKNPNKNKEHSSPPARGREGVEDKRKEKHKRRKDRKKPEFTSSSSSSAAATTTTGTTPAVASFLCSSSLAFAPPTVVSSVTTSSDVVTLARCIPATTTTTSTTMMTASLNSVLTKSVLETQARHIKSLEKSSKVSPSDHTNSSDCKEEGEEEEEENQGTALPAKLRCCYCHGFISKPLFSSHEKTCARRTSPCDSCGKVILDACLKSHKLHDCEEREVECGYCGNTMAAKLLDVHSDRCEYKPVECDFCGEEVSAKNMPLHHSHCPKKPKKVALPVGKVDSGARKKEKEKEKVHDIEVEEEDFTFSHSNLANISAIIPTSAGVAHGGRTAAAAGGGSSLNSTSNMTESNPRVLLEDEANPALAELTERELEDLEILKLEERLKRFGLKLE